jgi:hypothetical protein
VKVRRSRQVAALVALVALSIFAAAPMAAAWRPGWAVKRMVTHGPYTAIDTAKHCGASEFGTYTTRLAYSYTAGPLAGKTVHVIVTFALRNDHRRHRFHFVSVTGTAIATMSPADRHSVERALASTFSRYSIEVLSVLAGPQLTTRLWDSEKIVSTGRLGLARTRC